MKAFLRSKKWRITALVCLVAVAVTVSGTFAWYITSRRTDASLQAVTSEEGGAIVCGPYTVYLKTTDTSGAPVYQVYNALNDEIVLNAYDSVFGENEDTAIIMKIPVTGTSLDGGSDLLLTLSRANREEFSSDEFGLLANAADSGNHVEAGKIIKYLTNIASFRFQLIPALNGETNAGTIYETARAEFDKGTEAHAFVSWTRNQKTYTVTKDKNQLSWDIPAAGISAAKTADGALNLYVEINYDANLVAAYLQDHSASIPVQKLSDVELLRFVSDLTQAAISVKS